jgi:hypothetical protein
MGPVVRRSWAQRGCTPVLMQRGRNRINVHVIGALVITPRHSVRGYFSLSPGGSFDGELIPQTTDRKCTCVHWLRMLLRSTVISFRRGCGAPSQTRN